MTVIEGWEVFTEGEAIEAAIDKFGKDPMTSVVYCAIAADGVRKSPEFRFWFDLFLKLEKAAPQPCRRR
jgi:phosphoribosylformimino-5-aminoimidazole carboxamide ribonucleotide (ProFAR) isomerase